MASISEGSVWRVSRRRTCSWKRPGNSRLHRLVPSSSKTRSSVWRRGVPAGSGLWLVSDEAITPSTFEHMARISSSPTSVSCLLRSKAKGSAKACRRRQSRKNALTEKTVGGTSRVEQRRRIHGRAPLRESASASVPQVTQRYTPDDDERRKRSRKGYQDPCITRAKPGRWRP